MRREPICASLPPMDASTSYLIARVRVDGFQADARFTTREARLTALHVETDRVRLGRIGVGEAAACP